MLLLISMPKEIFLIFSLLFFYAAFYSIKTRHVIPHIKFHPSLQTTQKIANLVGTLFVIAGLFALYAYFVYLK